MEITVPLSIIEDDTMPDNQTGNISAARADHCTHCPGHSTLYKASPCTSSQQLNNWILCQCKDQEQVSSSDLSCSNSALYMYWYAWRVSIRALSEHCHAINIPFSAASQSPQQFHSPGSILCQETQVYGRWWLFPSPSHVTFTIDLGWNPTWNHEFCMEMPSQWSFWWILGNCYLMFLPQYEV